MSLERSTGVFGTKLFVTLWSNPVLARQLRRWINHPHAVSTCLVAELCRRSLLFTARGSDIVLRRRTIPLLVWRLVLRGCDWQHL
ncbi:hypothetical protein FPV67DRAFT_930485 [Lyophyllum atratum]|nr:hypothetical protein FPV67DRAFT_930485 [Lyophyllum atratum]